MRMPNSAHTGIGNTEHLGSAGYGAKHFIPLVLYSFKTTKWDELYYYLLHFAVGESPDLEK